ncbi:ZYRO0F13420p [Zygosaccharomyces rouxii]|uniref:Altered inheritance of mitochondria protein 24, mitochondrial n=1 Tax=Zygosaccharomyces rouxii (strain ATCC 2623 / CBS 732 / NBRC 1130 / NCYC 568 / NRRL Y-229) TaxID=559307 RepID=AIM24_ZYGRC|nr:uncharacterized protein ZYRO0F13420g [Zygosaccharomyces rouxii]C5DYJ0.1 RecName: Full=Altered inheritance of mitochondria protein 24, mitochondrial; Flags: Precursor [Zygosaccharomyces rouxii CBS 732]KAH9199608.1 altered inheritance of mitochondria protein 24, mitochondrial [Zygosaccharomyces rouxii]CAR28851.1 ZYRO0F13420p [Zygosaccharomyces rouxii]
MSIPKTFSQVSRRSISLVRPTATTLVPTEAELKTATQTNAEELFDDDDAKKPISTTKFQVLGQPATMASLIVPPSIPLYVRRGCLVSLHGAEKLSMNYEWVHFWSNLIHYRSIKPSIYHKLVSTSKFNALVAPNFLSNRIGPWLGLSSSPFRTLCLLNLNGSADWNVWGQDSVVAYENNSSLSVQPPNPFLIRLRSQAFSSKYQTVQGRGNVLLSGSGSVYTVDLKDAKDEIIIRSEHLLAVSGANRREITNAITEQKLSPPPEMTRKVPSEAGRFFESIRELDGRLFWDSSKAVGIKFWNWTRRIYSRLINGPTKYLKIQGPRTLLIQSSYNVYLPASPINRNSVEQQWAKPDSLAQNPSKNYFNYASVSTNGNVEFEATPNFNETVKKIEESGNKKR